MQSNYFIYTESVLALFVLDAKIKMPFPLVLFVLKSIIINKRIIGNKKSKAKNETIFIEKFAEIIKVVQLLSSSWLSLPAQP